MSLHDQEWGDGHRDRVTVYTQATHRYKSQGEYTITIRGIIVGWRFGEIDSHVDRSGGCRNNLLNIAQWGCLRLGNKGAYFAGCKKFRCNAKDALDLKDTTNLASMFCGASSFTSDLSAWQTGQVTDMSYMFRGASSFTSDLSAWQTGQVTNMSRMFYGASSFTSDLSAWQTGQVTKMTDMFFGACSFDGDVSCWGDHPEVARFLFSDSDYELRLLERKANAPRFQARALKNRNLMRNSIRLRQVLCVCM